MAGRLAGGRNHTLGMASEYLSRRPDFGTEAGRISGLEHLSNTAFSLFTR